MSACALLVLTCIQRAQPLMLHHAHDGVQGPSVLVAPGGHQPRAQNIQREAHQRGGDA